MPFCAQCGTRVRASQNFCGRCGVAISIEEDLQATEVPFAPARHAPLTLAYEVSTWRILVMTLLSFGLYLFYWYYLTWKQYREHTGREVFPVWHALTLLLPIYNLFRTHAHMRALRQLMLNAGLSSTISPGLAVALLVVIWLLNGLSIQLSGGLDEQTMLDQRAALSILALDGVIMALTAGLIVHVQANLNLYWSSLRNVALRRSRIGTGEIVLAGVGVMVWINTLATVFIPAYRAGYGG